MVRVFTKMLRALRASLGKSLRRRLVVAVSLVNVALMGTFATLVIGDQNEFLRDQGMEQADSLAQTLAVSSVSWILADDVAGLGEIVASMAANIPDVDSIMVVDGQGRVLAHSQPQHVGMHLVDPASRGLLEGPPQRRVLTQSATLVDVAQPAFSGDRLAGWARVRLELNSHKKLVAQAVWRGAAYALAAMVLGSALALWTARRLSRGMENLADISDQVRLGVRNVRADESRLDEIGNLGRGFNQMLDQVEATERSLTDTLIWKMKVLENNAAGILVVSGRRTVTEVNARFCAMLGCDPGQIIGESTAVLHLDRDAYEEFGRAVAEASGTDAPFTREVRLRRKDGSTFWCEVSGSAFDPDDPAKGRTWILIDITARKIQEQALRDSEEKFRTVAEYTYDWEYWTDPGGIILYCSPACERTTGYAARDFLQKPGLLAEIVHPEDRAQYLEHVLCVRKPETTRALTLDFRIVTRGGEVRDISHSCVPVYRDDGSWWGRRSCNRDVTEQRRTAWRIEQLNACFLAFGPDPEANIRHLVELAGRAANASSAHFLRGHKQPLRSVACWFGDNGGGPAQKADVQACLACLRDMLGAMPGEYGEAEEKDAGTPPSARAGFYVFQRVRWAGGELGALCLRLPQRREIGPVDKRFLAILGMAIGVEEQRRLYQEAITAALEEKNILIKEIHHRVKNNMQVMSSLISLQCANFQDAKALGLFKECEARILAMALVHEELYADKDMANIDFARYVRRLTDKLMTSLAPKARIAVRLHLDQLLLPVDKSIPCGLIFNELFTNALKHAFGDGAHGTVTVRLNAGEGTARLTVRDDGVGLPWNFDPHRGATLGLELVAGLADQLNATVSVDKVDRGASLTLTFPLEPLPPKC